MKISAKHKIKRRKYVKNRDVCFCRDIERNVLGKNKASDKIVNNPYSKNINQIKSFKLGGDLNIKIDR